MVVTHHATYRDLRYARSSRALVEVLPEASMNQVSTKLPFLLWEGWPVPRETFVVAGGKFGIRDHYEDRAANPTLRETDPHANVRH